MTELLHDRATAIWAALVGLTLLAWLASEASAAAALAIAFAKVFFVAREFMELRAAPTALRVAMDAWIAVVLTTLIALYAAR